MQLGFAGFEADLEDLVIRWLQFSSAKLSLKNLPAKREGYGEWREVGGLRIPEKV